MLQGITENTVLLADPSLGKRTYSKWQFLEMWETRQDKDAPEFKGKFLAIVPMTEGVVSVDGFFNKSPERQTDQVCYPFNGQASLLKLYGVHGGRVSLVCPIPCCTVELEE